MFHFGEELPSTFVFGDIFIPDGQFASYIRFAQSNSSRFDACIGVSKTKVGDYCVVIEGDCVVKLKMGLGTGLYTCGIFSIFDSGLVSALHKTQKLTEIFSEIVNLKKKVGFFEIKGAVDLDTPQDVALLEVQLKSSERLL
ncbi:MAG: hypothetical protein A2Z96_03765 [Spirochaetes bacterium GWB1_48_6]|nr:MAG: hypothetical protein A2Z96_03765 [Spirochaetes bacterium GWB1_48_6]